jgi:hypothetical protein
MNRLTDLFEQFSLPEISDILRRTAFIGAGLAIAAVVVTALVGHFLIGVGVALGLVLGIANIRLVTLSVARASERDGSKVKKILASNTLLRLGVTTAVILGLVYLVRDLGLGALAGVALFYFIFLSGVMRALFQQGVTA